MKFTLGKRDNNIRNKKYKKKNKKYKKLVAQGDSASKKGNFSKAEEEYQKAIDMNLDTNYAKVRLANLYRVQERLNEAIEICEPIIRSTPNPFAYLCLGICKFWQGEHYEALTLFESSFNIYPKHTNTILWLARVLIHLGQFEKAEKILENIKGIKNVSFEYLLLNYALYSAKDYKQKLKARKWRTDILYKVSSENRNFISKNSIPLELIYKETSLDFYWWNKLICAHSLE